MVKAKQQKSTGMQQDSTRTNAGGNGTATALIENRRTFQLAGAGIHTEAQTDRAMSAIFSDLADGRADFDQTRLMLSAIGKKLTLENLKLRAGVYKSGRGGFFLNTSEAK